MLKRKMFFILLVSMASVQFFSNGLDGQVIISENFETYVPEEKVFPPTDWTTLNGTNSGWTCATDEYEGEYNAETFWDGMEMVDWWLITGQATIPASNGKLSFYYRGGYDYDHYEVAFKVGISTTDTNPASFTTVWDSGHFSQPDVYDDYIQQVVDLSAYGGQAVYIGFNCYYQVSASHELQLDNIWVGSLSEIPIFGPESFDPPLFPPSGWTKIIADPNNPNDVMASSTYAYDGDYSARFSSYAYHSNYTQYLVTPPLGITALENQLDFYYQRHTAGTEIFCVGVDTQNTEPSTVTWGSDITDASTTWQQYIEDLTGYIGQTVYVWIQYKSDYQYYLYIDYCTFPDGMAESFEITFPPSGWTVESHGAGQDWVQDTAHDGGTANCSESGLEQDEWLITDTINCTGKSNVRLKCWHDLYISTISGDSFGEIKGSTDNGVTWDQDIASWDTSDYGDRIFDISSWADNQSQVRIRFRFYSTLGTSEYDEWDIDDVWIGERNENPLWTEGFEENIPQQWPVGWNTHIYSGEGNWICDTLASERPPDSAGYYARAKDFSGIDFEAGLFTPPMDLSGPCKTRLEFDHHFDKWLDFSDCAEVRVHSGGWYRKTIAKFNTDVDGHTVIIFDPAAYPNPSNMRIEFYYYDGGEYAEEWCIDNVIIKSSPRADKWLEEIDMKHERNH